MKRIAAVLFVIYILLAALSGCEEAVEPTVADTPDLGDTFVDYTKMVNGQLPEDISLTIYYMNPNLETRRPLSVEDLIQLHEKKIVVDAKTLAANQTLLQELTPGILTPLTREYYLDARVYYVLEDGNGEKLLDVAMWGYPYGVLVNGVPVQDSPVFYKLVDPYLTEEMRTALQNWK